MIIFCGIIVIKLTYWGVFMDNENKLGIAIKAMSNRMMRKLNGAAAGIDNESISSAQKRVIVYLYEQKDNSDIFQRDVEQYLSIRRPTATRMLNNMEENGLIRRESVDYDGRLKKLTLTEKSIDLYNGIFNDIDTVERNMTRGLTEDEKKEFLRIAGKIIKNLEG